MSPSAALRSSMNVVTAKEFVARDALRDVIATKISMACSTAILLLLAAFCGASQTPRNMPRSRKRRPAAAANVAREALSSGRHNASLVSKKQSTWLRKQEGALTWGEQRRELDAIATSRMQVLLLFISGDTAANKKPIPIDSCRWSLR